MDQQLLSKFVQQYPVQPATAIWRASEIAAVCSLGLPEGRGLDLGCGDGRLTRIVLDIVGFRHLVGLDIDEMETRQALVHSFYDAIHTTNGGAIPENSESFDFVYSNSVLEHIPDLDPVLAEVGRVLKPGGKFIFTVPAPGFHSCLRGSFLPWVSRGDYCKYIDDRLAHHRYPSIEQWREMLSPHRIGLESAHCYFRAAEVRRWETVSRITAGVLFKMFGGKQRPVDIQRNLGLRSLQERFVYPSTVAKLISFLLSIGLKSEAPIPDSASDVEQDATGGLLIVGRKT